MNKKQKNLLKEALKHLRFAETHLDEVWNDLSVGSKNSMHMAEAADLTSMAIRRVEGRIEK